MSREWRGGNGGCWEGISREWGVVGVPVERVWVMLEGLAGGGGVGRVCHVSGCGWRPCGACLGYVGGFGGGWGGYVT